MRIECLKSKLIDILVVSVSAFVEFPGSEVGKNSLFGDSVGP